jgi:hypothetical protein
MAPVVQRVVGSQKAPIPRVGVFPVCTRFILTDTEFGIGTVDQPILIFGDDQPTSIPRRPLLSAQRVPHWRTSLRDRPEDIRLLVRHLAMDYAARMNKPITAISEEFMAVLAQHSWPGNVRDGKTSLNVR